MSEESAKTLPKVLRIANGSGFYGDRLAAPWEMIEGGPIDVLTGDYLAELTLSILDKDRRKDPSLGYAKTFPMQLRRLARSCLERGIKIVVNAGGLSPAACADACRQVYAEQGLDAVVAHLEGDDLLPRLAQLQTAGEPLAHLDSGRPLAQLDSEVTSANVYLGARGIAEALERGADLVICPRVTDASLVVGPAAWFFGWAWADWDRLAGAVAAGHILECGPQATGGNFSGFRELGSLLRPAFPLAEIYSDGSFVVTKQPSSDGDLDGTVNIDTVTAQLLYEIGEPAYPNPDVTAFFDRLQLSRIGPDRVRVEGTVGAPPPEKLKVCVNYVGGHRNAVTFLLSEPDLDAKAALVEDAFWPRVGGRDAFDEVRVTLSRVQSDDPSDVEACLSFLRIAVKDRDPTNVGRRFSSAAVEMALASYPGFNLTAPPGNGHPFAVYWPALIDRRHVQQKLHIGGEVVGIDEPHEPPNGVHGTSDGMHGTSYGVPGTSDGVLGTSDGVLGTSDGVLGTSDGVHGTTPKESGEDTITLPLGRLVHARSGDKGGHVNVGLWVSDPWAWPWLRQTLTVETLRILLPEARDLDIERYELANLRAVNFVVRGFLGDGVASCLRLDAQGKGLGEFLRNRPWPLPRHLLTDNEKEGS